MDTERVFVYRALCIARGETKSLPADGHTLSVRAAAYILVGHELFHLRSLEENYGTPLGTSTGA